MTKIKNLFLDNTDPLSALSDFSIDVKRVPRGLSVSVSGVISVFELTDTSVGILTKRARVNISGERLILSVFEYRRAEISGRVENIGFKYGKN